MRFFGRSKTTGDEALPPLDEDFFDEGEMPDLGQVPSGVPIATVYKVAEDISPFVNAQLGREYTAYPDGFEFTMAVLFEVRTRHYTETNEGVIEVVSVAPVYGD